MEGRRRSKGMKSIDTRSEATVTEGPEAHPSDLEDLDNSGFLVSATETSPEMYPYMSNLSAGFMFQAVLVSLAPKPTEYITLRMGRGLGENTMMKQLAVAKWNTMWEAGHYRRRIFDDGELPADMQKIADIGDINVTFVPRTRSRYYEYAPLLHLLRRSTLERFGLPFVRAGQWPFVMDTTGPDRFLPHDFEQRLASAWSWEIWRRLVPGSPLSAFSKNDPVRLLSHNLDFWIPPVTHVIQTILGDFPEVDKGVEPEGVGLEDGTFLDGAVKGNPRMGGPIWLGEEEAAEALDWTVEAADETGSLRSILDAVRSNRVEDDFSDRWSFAREDFERKLYRKRSKITVRFVELKDTIPVQGPESEIIGQLVTNDFLTLLDGPNRQIVVLLNSGVTSQSEIAQILGYANHSTVSKRLKQIQKQAATYFDDF